MISLTGPKSPYRFRHIAPDCHHVPKNSHFLPLTYWRVTVCKLPIKLYRTLKIEIGL